jgi:hypothetical protein
VQHLRLATGVGVDAWGRHGKRGEERLVGGEHLGIAHELGHALDQPLHAGRIRPIPVEDGPHIVDERVDHPLHDGVLPGSTIRLPHCRRR